MHTAKCRAVGIIFCIANVLVIVGVVAVSILAKKENLDRDTIVIGAVYFVLAAIINGIFLVRIARDDAGKGTYVAAALLSMLFGFVGFIPFFILACVVDRVSVAQTATHTEDSSSADEAADTPSEAGFYPESQRFSYRAPYDYDNSYLAKIMKTPTVPKGPIYAVVNDRYYRKEYDSSGGCYYEKGASCLVCVYGNDRSIYSISTGCSGSDVIHTYGGDFVLADLGELPQELRDKCPKKRICD